MKQIRFIPLFFIIAASFFSLNAQQRFSVQHYVADSVVFFRWYPADMHSWKALLNSGVPVIQKAIPTGGKPGQSEFQNLAHSFHTDHLKWDSMALVENDSAYGFIRELFNQNDSLSPTDMAQWVEARERESNGLLTALLLIRGNPVLAGDLGMLCLDVYTEKTPPLYRIFFDNPDCRDTIYIRPGNALNKDTIPVPEPILGSVGGSVQVQWTTPPDGAPWFGFYPERSMDSGQHFVRLTEQPVYFGIRNDGKEPSFFDIPDISEGRVYYRFRLLNSFDTVSEYSVVRFIQYCKNTYRAPEFLYVRDSLNCGVVSWEHGGAECPELIRFDVVSGSEMHDSGVVLTSVGPQTSRAIVPLRHSENYFRVCAVFSDGAIRYSQPFFVSGPDTIPPREVPELKIQTDSGGVMRLSWNRPEAEEVLGYQVYRSNGRLAEFSNLSTVWMSDTFFMDTLDAEMIRDSIYYSVAVADYRYNESYSDTIAVALPRRSYMPPLIETESDGIAAVVVRCRWSEKGPGFTGKLYRRDTGKYLLLHTFEWSSDTVITDRKIIPGMAYIYQLSICKDDGNCSGNSPEVSLGIPERALQQFVEITGITSLGNGKGTLIEWQTQQNPVVYYRIYRFRNGQPETIGTVSGNITYYNDRKTKDQHNVNYKIMAYYEY